MKTTIILIGSLFLGTLSVAMTSKVDKPVLVRGSSIGEYAKPGAPVDINYTSEHVNVGDVSRVDIELSSSVLTGSMSVKVKVDEDLSLVNNLTKHLSFNLGKGKKNYPLHLKVIAHEDGLYYIHLMVAIKGKGMRTFAVPVYIGKGNLRNNKVDIKKTTSGESVTVFSGEETTAN